MLIVIFFLFFFGLPGPVSSDYLQNTFTYEPLYNAVHYNMILDITQVKDGSRNVVFYVVYTFLFGYSMLA